MGLIPFSRLISILNRYVDMSDEYPDISKLRVVDLKALCSEYGLEAKGKKAELQAKLLSFFDANPKHATADVDAVEESVAEAAEETAEPVEPEVEATPEEPSVVEAKEVEE